MRAMREAAGLSQSELAGLLGVAPNTVARWERGERPIVRTTELATRHVLGSHESQPYRHTCGQEPTDAVSHSRRGPDAR